jgi:hypothetical protein
MAKVTFHRTGDLPPMTDFRLTVNGSVLPWDGGEPCFVWETDATERPLSAVLELAEQKGFFSEFTHKIREIRNPLLRLSAWLLVPLFAILTVPISVILLVVHHFGDNGVGGGFWLHEICPFRGRWAFSLPQKDIIKLTVSTSSRNGSPLKMSPPRLWVDGVLTEGDISFDASLLNRGFARCMTYHMIGLGTLCLLLEGCFLLFLISLVRGNLAVTPEGITGFLVGLFLVLLIALFLALPILFFRATNAFRKKVLAHNMDPEAQEKSRR